VATHLGHAEGRAAFDESSLDITHFSATLGERVLNGTYHYAGAGKRLERVRLEIPALDLKELESALEPTLQAQGFLARLRFTRRMVPTWLTGRNLEGDLVIDRFSINNANLGALSSHFIWQGTNLQFTSLQLKMPAGSMRGRGTVNLASYSPHCRFSANLTGFPWRGGSLNAEGEFETSGTGTESLEHLHAMGTFSGQDLDLSADDSFSKVSGLFDLSFENGWPNLRLSNIQASDVDATEGEEAWEGSAASQSDGRLIFDLVHAGRSRRVVSTLLPETPAAISSLNSRPLPN
jgi:hypothetical protein